MNVATLQHGMISISTNENSLLKEGFKGGCSVAITIELSLNIGRHDCTYLTW